MEFQQVRHFIAVAEERHFTRAARREHIVQSGLSASVRALESELGSALFTRSTRRVELTEAGRAFLVEAKRILSAVQSATDAVRGIEGLLHGTLQVGIMQPFATRIDLPGVIGRFHAKHPGLQIRLQQAGAQLLTENLRGGQLDIAVLAQVSRPHESITATLLERDSVVLAVPPDHALGRRKQVSLATLGDETFVEFYPDWAARELSDRVFASLRVTRKVACEVNDIPTLLDLVAHGLGIALIPRAFTQYRANIKLVDPRPQLLSWDVVVAHVGATPASAAARALSNAFKENSLRVPIKE